MKAVLQVAAGLVVASLGAFVIGIGTGGFGFGALGMRSETFDRISCSEQRVKKGSDVWHCFGHSTTTGERQRLSFTPHDGRDDPEEITATQVPALGERWYARSAGMNSVGTGILLAGAGLVAWGVTWRRPAG